MAMKKLYDALYDAGGKAAKLMKKPFRKKLTNAAIELERANQESQEQSCEAKIIERLKDLVHTDDKNVAQEIVADVIELERELEEAKFNVRAVDRIKERLEGPAPEDLEIEAE